MAVVNGQVITLFDLNMRLKPIMDQYRGKELSQEERMRLEQMRKQALDQMIADLLISGEAESLGIQVSQQDLESELRQFKESRGLTDEQFEQQLSIEGVDRDEFLEKMRKDIVKHRLLQYMVRNKVVVTQEEIKQAYESEGADVSQDRKVRLGLILFPEQMSGQEVRRRIESGEMTFAEAADRYTQGPGSGQGGNLGLLSWKDLAENWRDALKGLQPGQVSELFKVNGQDALLLLVDVQEGDKPKLDEVRDKIYDELYNEKLDVVFQEYLGKLREKAVIERKD